MASAENGCNIYSPAVDIVFKLGEKQIMWNRRMRGGEKSYFLGILNLFLGVKVILFLGYSLEGEQIAYFTQHKNIHIPIHIQIFTSVQYGRYYFVQMQFVV